VALPDLTNIPLGSFFLYLVIIAAADVFWNTALAIAHKNFSADYVADFVRTHILLRILAIGIFAAFGHGVPGLGIPEIPAVSLAATGALAAYAVETVWSMKGALTDTRPVPEPPTPTPAG